MKILAIIGSRNKNGQTASAVDQMLRKASDMGAHTESVFLTQIRIDHCRQCEDNGWGECRRTGKCIIEDDFGEIIEKIRNCDVVVFATPVYFGDLSESIRAFLDRLRRTYWNENGKIDIKKKYAFGVCVAGGGGGGSFSCAASLEKIISGCGFDIIDIIPVRRQNTTLKNNVLKVTGEWIIKNL